MKKNKPQPKNNPKVDANNTKVDVNDAQLAPAELLTLPVNDLILPEVATLVNQINQTRALYAKLEETLAPIVRTAFAQAGIDVNNIAEVNFDSDRKAFTYILK